MQIVINIEKKHFYAIILAICFLSGGLVFAYNSGGTRGIPSRMGHSFDEVAGGTAQLGQIDCNAYNDGDCDGMIPGIVMRGQPENGNTVLELVDISPTVPGGNALKVDGNAIFVNGDIALSQVIQDAGSIGTGNHPLCIVRSYGNDNGKIVVC